MVTPAGAGGNCLPGSWADVPARAVRARPNALTKTVGFMIGPLTGGVERMLPRRGRRSSADAPRHRRIHPCILTGLTMFVLVGTAHRGSPGRLAIGRRSTPG